ncbi:MAG: dockerin type I domain-containing protein [Planctomycetota bacterium]
MLRSSPKKDLISQSPTAVVVMVSKFASNLRSTPRRKRKRNRVLSLEHLEAKKLLAVVLAASMAEGECHSGMVDHGHDSSGSHGSDAESIQMGHMAVMNLVPTSAVTNTVVASGNWSDPSVWSGNQLPQDGAAIHIPACMTLNVDYEVEEEFKTIRVDGTLNFLSDRNTEIRVDTLVSTPMGQLVIGTEENPIREDVTANIVFADDGPIDRAWDPTIVSRGALLHGKTTIHGAVKDSFISLPGDSTEGAARPVQGANQVTLAAEPNGWRVGDVITIAGVDPNDPESDEVVTITEIDGSTITFDTELVRDHIAPRADLEVHVANLTRNIVFRSENPEAEHRAHVMFMHTNNVDARYVAFEDLGRTDKSIDLEDWRLISDSEGSVGEDETEVEELDGFNVRGRYSVHFHRGGASGEPAIVQGAVVQNDPGWAYVNHSSNVDFLDNVSYNVTGAAYNTEAGDEVGSFIRNIAIRTVNPEGNPNPPDNEVNFDQSPDIRVLTQDFGWQGDGFWFHGPGVTVEDNVVSGASGHGFIYWTLGLVEQGLGEKLVDVVNLPNGDLIGEPGTMVRPKHVPVPSFDGNTVYSAVKGLNVAYLHTDNRDDNDEHFVGEGLLAAVPQEYEETLQSTFSNFTAWNVPLSGIAAPYSGRLTFENIELVGTGAEGSVGLKLDQFANQNDITVRNVSVDGYLVGIAAQRNGDAMIDGAQISAVTDIRINVPDRDARNLEISNIEFLPLSDLFEPDEERLHISMDAAFDLGLAEGLFGIEDAFFDEETLINIPPVFLKDRITFNNPGYDDVGLFFDAQDPDFVPVPPGRELSQFVPEELVGLSNRELQEEFGISFSDALLPENAVVDPLVTGGQIGIALPYYPSFPPAFDSYWVDFFAGIGIELGGGDGSGGDGNDDDLGDDGDAGDDGDGGDDSGDNDRADNDGDGGDGIGDDDDDGSGGDGDDFADDDDSRGRPEDVNFDGRVSLLDALIVINHLYRDADDFDGTGDYNADVNRDGNVTSIDALLVINYILQDLLGSQGEGEWSSDLDPASNEDDDLQEDWLTVLANDPIRDDK